MEQGFQIVGAVLVLLGYALSQSGRLSSRSLLYLWLNLLGSGTLAVLALHERQWGFLLLEGVWAAISLVGMLQEVKRAAKPRRGRRRESSG